MTNTCASKYISVHSCKIMHYFLISFTHQKIFRYEKREEILLITYCFFAYNNTFLCKSKSASNIALFLTIFLLLLKIYIPVYIFSFTHHISSCDQYNLSLKFRYSNFLEFILDSNHQISNSLMTFFLHYVFFYISLFTAIPIIEIFAFFSH